MIEQKNVTIKFSSGETLKLTNVIAKWGNSNFIEFENQDTKSSTIIPSPNTIEYITIE